MAPGCCKYVLDATLCCISPSLAPQTLRWKHPCAFQAALHFLKQTTRHSRSTAGTAGHGKHFALVQPSLAANISPWRGKNPSVFSQNPPAVVALFGEAPNMAAATLAPGETFGAAGWSAAERKSDFTKRKAMTWGKKGLEHTGRLGFFEGPGEFVWCIVQRIGYPKKIYFFISVHHFPYPKILE